MTTAVHNYRLVLSRSDDKQRVGSNAGAKAMIINEPRHVFYGNRTRFAGMFHTLPGIVATRLCGLMRHCLVPKERHDRKAIRDLPAPTDGYRLAFAARLHNLGGFLHLDKKFQKSFYG